MREAINKELGGDLPPSEMKLDRNAIAFEILKLRYEHMLRNPLRIPADMRDKIPPFEQRAVETCFEIADEFIEQANE